MLHLQHRQQIISDGAKGETASPNALSQTGQILIVDTIAEAINNTPSTISVVTS